MRPMLVVTLLLLGACQSSSTLVIDGHRRSDWRHPVSLLVEEMSRSASGTHARVRISNESSVPLEYYSYAPERPVHSLSYRTSLGWSAQQLSLCGTGLRPRTIRPGESFAFDVPLGKHSRHPVRVVVQLTYGERTVIARSNTIDVFERGWW